MKNKTRIRDIISNTFTVVARKNLTFFIAALVGFVLLYSFFYGIYTIPIIELGFFKDVKPGVVDYLYITSASLLSALIVTLTRYSLKNKSLTRGTSFSGILAGSAATICPVCLGVNFLVFGSFITLPLISLVPYAFFIQLAGLALLTLGLWLTIKNSYDNICLACITDVKAAKRTKLDLFNVPITPLQRNVFFGFLIIAVFALGYQVLPLVAGSILTSSESSNVTGHGQSFDMNSIIAEVVPEEGFTIDATWQDSINNMVESGVLDVDKLDNILTKRYGQPLTEEQRALLTAEYSDEKLTINKDNAVFMMYVLWVLGKDNDNQILHDSPFAQYFDDYDIGVGKSGYGDTKLIELTPEQQESAEYVALNSYRPCCGNPTGWPDCSHGFSALGLIELMASQGYSQEEIFDAFVKFNSFWFPSTYIQDAIYFKLVENKDWKDVDKELVAGKQYSSLSGAYAVRQYLQGLGI